MKKLTQNLARQKNVDWKSDKSKKFYFKIWHDEKTLIENHAFHKKFLLKIMLFKKSFLFKIMLFRKFFSSNSCFLKVHVKGKVCAFYGVKWIKTWFFVCNFFSKICFLRSFFSSKSCSLKNYFSSKSDAL